jgi:Vitamin K-dependent gamma-carboxylase
MGIEVNMRCHTLRTYFSRTSSIAPLAVFRIFFGLAMVLSTARFLALGWVREQYILPKVHFSYYGFECLQPLQCYGLPEGSMYAVFAVMLLSALGIMLGAWYRLASVAFFLTFTYIELLDKTYYLNHYYFVSVMSFVLMLLPAHRACSVDVWCKPLLLLDSVPHWMIDVVKFQVGIVYVYAGLAKINSDWLFRAMPLAIWLPANDTLPLVGWTFRLPATAYIFSWSGMLFDCTIPFWLSWKRSRYLAYTALVVFHCITGWMFQIGVFPLVMCLCTPIFFAEEWHKCLLATISSFVPLSPKPLHTKHTRETFSIVSCSCPSPFGGRVGMWAAIQYLLAAHCIAQILIPWRFLLYDGNLFWTEQGYRFSWRVMLMEKAGTATFTVRNGANTRVGVVVNRDFLNAHQEKQMAMQPDMIVQFAQYLKRHYEAEGMMNPRIYAEVYVTLNGRPSRLLMESTLDVASLRDDFSHKYWILPFQE